MAQMPRPSNSEDNNSTGGFETIPEDTYTVMLSKSEWKDAKSGNGNKFIYCEFTILDGEYAGQKLFIRLNLVNSNPVAVRIAEQQLNQLCVACLKSDVEDTEELHGIPVNAYVVVKDNEGTDYPPQNEIKKFENVDGASFEAPWG